MAAKNKIGLLVAVIVATLLLIQVDPAIAFKVVQGNSGKLMFASDRGPRGPQGYPGPAGVPGPQGVTGPRGYRGYRGKRGHRGRRGYRGSKGRRGVGGQRGEQGAQGERGPQGPSGQVQIESGTITTDDLVDAAVTTEKLADGAVDNSKLAADAVTSVNILDGAIVSSKIAMGAVDSTKLMDWAVGTAQLADMSVTNSKLTTNSVTSANIAGQTIVAEDIANGAVGSDQIANGAVSTGKLADGAVTSAKILDGAIEIYDIAQSVWSDNVHCTAATTSSLPTASGSNVGFICLATDENGGTLYRSNGSSWVKVARGATETAQPVIQQATLIDSFPSLGSPVTLSANGHGPDYARVFPFTLNGTLTVNQVNIRTNTACTDALIVGIFDSSGTSVWQSGAQSTVAGNLVITSNLPVTLAGGSQYYFATTNNDKTGGVFCYSVTPALNQANVPRWGTVTTSAGAMPSSINPEDITETTGGWMAFVTLSTFTS